MLRPALAGPVPTRILGLVQPLDDPRAETLSRSARRLLRRPRPRFRGVLHRWAAVASVPAGVVLVAFAEGSRARVAIAVFSLGMTAMLGVSAVVHGRDWGIDQVETVVRVDHTAIFAMFATTSTPIAMLVLEDPIATWLLAVAWVGAGIGITAEWIPVHPPAGVVNAVYLTFGWSMVAFTPWMVAGLSEGQTVLLFGGGAAYTLGAVIVGARWPDPWTESFGYHEIWHVLVVIACALHAGMVGSIAL